MKASEIKVGDVLEYQDRVNDRHSRLGTPVKVLETNGRYIPPARLSRVSGRFVSKGTERSAKGVPVVRVHVLDAKTMQPRPEQEIYGGVGYRIRDEFVDGDARNIEGERAVRLPDLVTTWEAALEREATRREQMEAQKAALQEQQKRRNARMTHLTDTLRAIGEDHTLYLRNQFETDTHVVVPLELLESLVDRITAP